MEAIQNFAFEILLDNITELVLAFMAIVLTPAMTSAIMAFKNRMNQSAIVARLDKEGLMRAGFNEAILTAVNAGLARDMKVEDIIHEKVSYVLASVPEYAKELGATEEIIKEKLAAAILGQLSK